MNIDNGFQWFLKKTEEFEQTHMEVLLPERAALIWQQYRLLVTELAGEAICTICEESKSIYITITADSFLTCNEAHSLNCLIGMANYSEIKIVEHQIVLHLWFRCWEWIGNHS